MISNEQIDRVLAERGNVIDINGEKVGGVVHVYTDDETGQPNWVTVRVGLFGSRELFVSLQRALLEGEDVVVPYTKEHIQGAPRILPDRHLGSAEEDRLSQHYRLTGGGFQGST